MILIPKKISTAAPASWITHEYATISPFNVDNSKLLLVHQHHYELYDGEGNWLQSLPLSADSEPRWSTRDPNLLYYKVTNELRSMDIRNPEQLQVLRVFPGYHSILGEKTGEADISEDGDLIACCGDGRDVFLYRISTNSIISVPFGGHLNSIYITPDNNVLLSGNDHGAQLYEVQKRTLRKVAPSLAHQDVGRDTNGDPVLVRTNSGDPASDLIPACANGIEKVNLATGQRTCLWAVGYHPAGGVKSQAVHISMPRARLGWCLVSTYSPTNSDPSRVYKVPLDGSGPELLCETESWMPPPDDNGNPTLYNATPKASACWDGSRFVFASNSMVKNRGVHYCDVFMVKMEKAAPVPAPVPLPVPVPPAPTPAPVPVPAPVEAGENPWERIDYTRYFQEGWEYLWEPLPNGDIRVYQRKKKGR